MKRQENPDHQKVKIEVKLSPVPTYNSAQKDEVSMEEHNEHEMKLFS